jgi:hypothetical protein
MLLRDLIFFIAKCNSRNQNTNYHDRRSEQNKRLHGCKNNLLKLSFRWLYKRFTYPLHFFTIKKLQDSCRPIPLLYCFTKSFLVMNIIYNLAFLLLFQFPFACNEALEFQASFPITDSQQEQKSDKTAAANIVFKSTDGGQSWQDISKGLPGDKLEGSLFVNDRGFYLRTGNYIYLYISQ